MGSSVDLGVAACLEVVVGGVVGGGVGVGVVGSGVVGVDGVVVAVMGPGLGLNDCSDCCW